MRASLSSIIVVLLVFTIIYAAEAQDMTCRYDDLFRRVQVVTDDDRRGLPCSVLLWSSPATQRTAWRAEFERGFCTEKAKDMVERLIDAGWQCNPTEPRRSRSRPRPASKSPVM